MIAAFAKLTKVMIAMKEAMIERLKNILSWVAIEVVSDVLIERMGRKIYQKIRATYISVFSAHSLYFCHTIRLMEIRFQKPL